jgi:hypothetical protein
VCLLTCLLPAFGGPRFSNFLAAAQSQSHQHPQSPFQQSNRLVDDLWCAVRHPGAGVQVVESAVKGGLSRNVVVLWQRGAPIVPFKARTREVHVLHNSRLLAAAQMPYRCVVVFQGVPPASSLRTFDSALSNLPRTHSSRVQGLESILRTTRPSHPCYDLIVKCHNDHTPRYLLLHSTGAR